MDQLAIGRTPSAPLPSIPISRRTARTVASRLASVWRFSLVALATAMMTIASASAHKTHISRIEYTNNGSYVAWFYIRYKYQGEVCKIYLKGNYGTSAAYKTAYVDLTKDFKIFRGPKTCLIDKKIPENIQVWGIIKIGDGSNVSCKKSEKLYYSSSSRVTRKFKSGGTTLNNNRCKKAD